MNNKIGFYEKYKAVYERKSNSEIKCKILFYFIIFLIFSIVRGAEPS